MKKAYLLLLMFLIAFSQAGYSQSLVLSSTNVAPTNSIRLHWTWIPTKPSANYSFTLFQWDDVLADWQTTAFTIA